VKSFLVLKATIHEYDLNSFGAVSIKIWNPNLKKNECSWRSNTKYLL